MLTGVAAAQDELTDAPIIAVFNGQSYAQGTWTGTGQSCLPGSTTLQNAQGSIASGSGGLATETTQVANQGLLTSIRNYLQTIASGSGSSGGATTGGDLTRSANATESIAAQLGGSNPSLAAEGEAALAAGAAASATEAGLHAAVPQSTVDFSGALSGVSFTLFGSGSCPAPANFGTWNGEPLLFSYGPACQFLSYLSVLVMMAGALSGFRIALS